MKVEFKNGCELKVIPSDVSTRPSEIFIYYQKYPAEFVKDCLPDIWGNLHWYQKACISSLIKAQNLKEQFVTLVPKQRVCINCGKQFKGKQYYYMASRGGGKTINEMARFTRGMCCSNECFAEYWNKFWRNRNEVIND